MKLENRLEGAAVLYCDRAFATSRGKAADALVRCSRRYRILAVVDSRYAGEDAGEVLDGEMRNLPILADLCEAIAEARDRGFAPTHLVVASTPEGTMRAAIMHADVRLAIELGLHIDVGTNFFLADDPDIRAAAQEANVSLIDMRRDATAERNLFNGRIDEVEALKVAVLGTDTSAGKNTTSRRLVDALVRSGRRAEMVGSGPTSRLQGVRYGIVLDERPFNDRVAGRIERIVHRAWAETGAEVLVVEGRGSLLHPSRDGGFEILAAARPDVVVLQHVLGRSTYETRPDVSIESIDEHLRAISRLGDHPVIAFAVRTEGLSAERAAEMKDELRAKTGLPVCDPIADGVETLCDALQPLLTPRGNAPLRAAA